MATADSVRDRRQAREERGVRSSATTKAGGERLPTPPRERKPALAALAVLLIVGGAAIAGLLAMRMDERVPVVVAARDIPVGTELTAELLTTTPVASDVESLIPESQLDQLIGRRTNRDIAGGEFITTTVANDSDGWLREGFVAVGALLNPGQTPATGLKRGDLVTLVRVDDGAGEVIVEGVRVSGTAVGEGNSSGTLVTFIVEPGVAPTIAATAAEGNLAVVLISRGLPLEDGE
jgi:hypothetical protein